MAGVAPFPPVNSPQATRTLMVLGLLQGGPRHGYDIHRIVVAHGGLYAEFKKPTLYHLLARLADQGAVEMTAESGARGPRGERLVYAITPAGRRLFGRLLRAMLGTYDVNTAGFQVAAGFLSWIPPEEGAELLARRRAAIMKQREEVVAELDHLSEPVEDPHDAARRVSRFHAADHTLCMMDAEIAWIDRTLRRLVPVTQTNRRKRS